MSSTDLRRRCKKTANSENTIPFRYLFTTPCAFFGGHFQIRLRFQVHYFHLHEEAAVKLIKHMDIISCMVIFKYDKWLKPTAKFCNGFVIFLQVKLLNQMRIKCVRLKKGWHDFQVLFSKRRTGYGIEWKTCFEEVWVKKEKNEWSLKYIDLWAASRKRKIKGRKMATISTGSA